MTDVKNLLLSTLENEFHYPIYLQGSMSVDSKYPDSFFTFWNNSTDDTEFYDNSETQTIWNFDLNFYSNDPELVNTVLYEAKLLLRSVGFIPDGSGYDVLSDEITHSGRGINLLFIQKVG